MSWSPDQAVDADASSLRSQHPFNHLPSRPLLSAIPSGSVAITLPIRLLALPSHENRMINRIARKVSNEALPGTI